MATAGARLKAAITTSAPLAVVGTVNAYSAILAKAAGHRAIYLSGGGVAAASHGLPDLGITNSSDVVEDVRRITNAVPDVPLLVDIDTGFGAAFGIARTIRDLEAAGAGGVHIEDQVAAKRCGHRPGKQLVSTEEMVDRVKAAVDARKDPDFFIMARTDALANEGLEATITRCKAYLAAGADAIFPEAFTELQQYKALSDALGPEVPILANITEFGKTPLFSQEQLGAVGVKIVLYPLSAFRAMSQAALKVYNAIADQGSQESVVDLMQTRAELYDHLEYHKYEKKLDDLFAQGKGKNA